MPEASSKAVLTHDRLRRAAVSDRIERGDAPYYVKGTEHLYTNSYENGDHAQVAAALASVTQPWLVTYDDAPAIRELYLAHNAIAYTIPYTAHTRYHGNEVAFTSPSLALPVRAPGAPLGPTAAAAAG